MNSVKVQKIVAIALIVPLVFLGIMLVVGIGTSSKKVMHCPTCNTPLMHRIGIHEDDFTGVTVTRHWLEAVFIEKDKQ